MSVYDGSTLLATLEPLLVSPNNDELHVEQFHPTELVRTAQVHLGRLIFLELCEYVSVHFHQAQAISFVFSRRVDILGGGQEQAHARVETMSRIGATDLQVTPKPDALPGQFSVSGVWLYSERNLAALRVVLEEERVRYDEWANRNDALSHAGRLLAALRRRLKH